jgi:zinc transport system substrate-binding protein
MSNMKKAALLATALIVIIAVAATAGIYYLTQPSKPQTNTKLNVIATFYPLYDFAQNVGGDKVTVSILVPETVDVHDFEPTPSSISAVSTADVLIYNGVGLEPWIANIVTASDNPDLIQVDTSQGVTLLPVAQQFQSGNMIYDPHIWLNPVDAQQQVRNILQGLIQADPADSQYFTQNADAYLAKLDVLNQQAINATTGTATSRFVTFHEAFSYFANQYNITQVPILGPFEEEPSAGDIQNVIEAIHQYHLRYVGYESLENPAISQSISTQTNAALIEMNPIEGITDEQKAAEDNYITLMQHNIETIHLALTNIDTT